MRSEDVADVLTMNGIIEDGMPVHSLARPIFLCCLLMVCDSFDVAALAFAAPSLMVEWRMSSAKMGLVFSVGLFGLLVGSVLFGWIGDRYGRRRALILGSSLFTLFTTATAFAGDATALTVLRFLAAVNLGGAVPNAVALISENSPKRLCATGVGFIFAGYSIGGLIAGLVASVVVPDLGWQSMFLIGGALSLLTSIALVVYLPESLPYLIARPSRHGEAVELARRLRPDLSIAPDAGFQAAATDVAQGRAVDLFRGQLVSATPLLWLAYIALSMTVSFLASWLPTAVERLGLSASMASLALAFLFGGSALGGIAGGRLVDRYGVIVIAPLALVAVPAIAIMGHLAQSPEIILLASFFVGAFAFGCQTCLHGVAGGFYPVSVRALGVGWAIGIAKIGAIAGPYIGGYLLSSVSTSWLFFYAASPLVTVAIFAVGLARLRADSRISPSADVHRRSTCSNSIAPTAYQGSLRSVED